MYGLLNGTNSLWVTFSELEGHFCWLRLIKCVAASAELLVYIYNYNNNTLATYVLDEIMKAAPGDCDVCIPGMLWRVRAMFGTFMRRFIATNSVLSTDTSLSMSSWYRVDGLLARQCCIAARWTRNRDSRRSKACIESGCTSRTALVSCHWLSTTNTFLYCATDSCNTTTSTFIPALIHSIQLRTTSFSALVNCHNRITKCCLKIRFLHRFNLNSFDTAAYVKWLHLVKEKTQDDVIETRHEVAAFNVEFIRRHCSRHLQTTVVQLWIV